jgi:hypothetical protein
LRKKRSWLGRLLGKSGTSEEEGFERTLIDLLRRGEVFFPMDGLVERFFREIGEREKDETVLERCLKKLKRRGDNVENEKNKKI